LQMTWSLRRLGQLRLGQLRLRQLSRSAKLGALAVLLVLVAAQLHTLIASVLGQNALLSDEAAATHGWEEISGAKEIQDGVCEARITPRGRKSCAKQVTNADAGFCVVLDRATGRRIKVMRGFKDGLRQSKFRCGDVAVDFANFKLRMNAVAESALNLPASPPPQPGSSRGIVMSVHTGVMLSAAASLRRLRKSGCTLPVELFHGHNELDREHPLVKEVHELGNVSLRFIEDPRFSRYYTKIYAVLHSAYDHVLLLDTDNLVARDPEYLFNTPEFREKGAIFWPDHWHPDDPFLFHMDHTSLAWELFDVPFIYMHEFEAGQVMIDRIRSKRALAFLEAYVYNARLIERLQVVWGDKDLFRFAFLRANTTFHMIQDPPGLAGFYLLKLVYCGQTLVQHDPSGGVAFFHRNTRKLGSFKRWDSQISWRYMEQFEDENLRKYRARPTLWYFGSCWRLCNGRVRTTQIVDKYSFIETDAVNYVFDAIHRYGMSWHRHSDSSKF